MNAGRPKPLKSIVALRDHARPSSSSSSNPTVPTTAARPALTLLPTPARRLLWRPPPLVPVCWCIRGMTVYAPKSNGRGWVLCVVRCMSGYRARVSNPLHGIDGWYHLDSLRVPRGSTLALRD
jgi:hypothetical protein